MNDETFKALREMEQAGWTIKGGNKLPEYQRRKESETSPTTSGSDELFRIIEPAMFNYPDRHYIDKALADLQARIAEAEIAAYRAGYAKGGVDEIVRHDKATKEVLAQLQRKQGGGER